MKKFDTPRMERINLVRHNIMATSLCIAQYCDSHECDRCEGDDTTCFSVSPCTVHNCGHVLCQTYTTP